MPMVVQPSTDVVDGNRNAIRRELVNNNLTNDTIHDGSSCRQPTPDIAEDVSLCRNLTGDKTHGVSSCQALRHAVSSLHRLDDFVQEPLGSGFFSQVYKVTHKTTGKVMVLKMNMNFNNRPNMLREVQLMNRLKHPNILRFMGVCVHEGQLHALTEYINRGSLEELLADRMIDLSWHVKLRLGKDVAKGMCYLHARGVMHRDLTSKNILVRETDGQYTGIVGDFGLACKIPDPILDKVLGSVGSPYWMAPECINAQVYDEKADVFSYGIILCEVLARVEADPDVLPRTRHFGVDYVAFSKMVDDVPHEFLGFLHLALNCCQIDPKKRQSFLEIVDSLEELKSKSQMAAVLADINSLQSDDLATIDKQRLDRVTGCKKKLGQRSPSVTPPSKEISPPRIELFPELFVGRDLVDITPQVVAEFLSEQDEFYTPHRDNPFVARFKDGSVKLVGSIRENWNAWFELPSPSRAMTPPATPSTPDDFHLRAHPLRMNIRRCHSLPGSPTIHRREFDRFHDAAASSSSATKRTFSAMTSIRRLEEEFIGCDDSFDSRSDSDSNDSALGLDTMMKDFRSLMLTPRGAPYHRKLSSVETSCLLNSSVDRYRSRTELLAMRENSPLRVHPVLRDRPHSWLGEDVFYSTSSSESCISMEDALTMSPSSSFSGYSDLDSELLHLSSAVHLDLTRLNSRQRFQELVRAWETKLLAKGSTPTNDKHAGLPALHTPIFRPRCFLTCSKESCDYYMERVRKFQELRRKWELQQQTSASDATIPTSLKPQDGLPNPAPLKPQDGLPNPAPLKPQDGLSNPAPLKPQDGLPNPAPLKPQDGLPNPAPLKPQDGLPSPAPLKSQDGLPSLAPFKLQDGLPSLAPFKLQDGLPSPAPLRSQDGLPSPTSLKSTDESASSASYEAQNELSSSMTQKLPPGVGEILKPQLSGGASCIQSKLSNTNDNTEQTGTCDNWGQPGTRDNSGQPGTRDNSEQPGTSDVSMKPGTCHVSEKPGTSDLFEQTASHDLTEQNAPLQ